MTTIRISQSVYEALRGHAEESYPHECCGAVLGLNVEGEWQVADTVRALNTRTDSAHNRYCIAPAELVRIQRDAMRHGFEIAGFYHSHPDEPAHWSSIDLVEAHWLGCAYLITEVAHGRAAVTNSFLLAGTTEEDKRFEPQLIVLET